MAEGKLRDEWARTCSLLALIANVNRAKGKPRIKPDEINPYRKKTKPIKVGIVILKDVFIKGNVPGAAK